MLHNKPVGKADAGMAKVVKGPFDVKLEVNVTLLRANMAWAA